MLDAVSFSRDLIRCPSVTPLDEGVFDLLQKTLESMGFVCHRLPFQEPGTELVENLYARLGTEGPNFCYAGHLDVVPTGETSDWSVDPFAAEIKDGMLFGRGASDMKASIAAFVAAVAAYQEQQGQPAGSISLLITGDEEGPAINGTRKVLDWMAEHGETIDHCVVGEPTNPGTFGEMMKIGRRGSINFDLTVHGTQGHVAYPHRADNPLPRLVKLLDAVAGLHLDEGSEHFDPSTLALTTIDTGNTAENVIPQDARGKFNIRFNDLHSSTTLEKLVRETLDAIDTNYTLKIRVSGESFINEPGLLSDIVGQAVKEETGLVPELSTTGGTSDARFITNVCPVLEFGLVGRTMHKVDEHVAVEDIESLARVYTRILDLYFSGKAA